MPDRLVLVTGTGTEVGKTWVACELLAALRAEGRTVAAAKPAQSFDAAPTDADLLALATGQSPQEVCPSHRWYPIPYAPPMAAEALGRPPFTIADLAAETRFGEVDVALVEGAGGPRSPLAADGDTVDLAGLLDPDLVVVVAPAGLGAINAARLSADVFAPRPVVVHLNRFDPADPLHAANARWLQGAGYPVTTSLPGITAMAGPFHCP
jgi:dethiobiotin synthetase